MDFEWDSELGYLVRTAVGLLVGICVWIYAAFELGALGWLFGWLPGIVFGAIAAALTPLFVLLLLLGLGIAWGCTLLYGGWWLMHKLTSYTMGLTIPH